MGTIPEHATSSLAARPQPTSAVDAIDDVRPAGGQHEHEGDTGLTGGAGGEGDGVPVRRAEGPAATVTRRTDDHRLSTEAVVDLRLDGPVHGRTEGERGGHRPI